MLLLRFAAVCGFICALGNIVVGSTADRMAYCQQDAQNCDEKAWKILGPLVGIMWIVECGLILQIPPALSQPEMITEDDSCDDNSNDDEAMVEESSSQSTSVFYEDTNTRQEYSLQIPPVLSADLVGDEILYENEINRSTFSASEFEQSHNLAEF